MITKEMLNTPLQACLEAFEGNPKDGVHTLVDQFELLARKMLYGGHFEVRDNSKDAILRRVFLHTVEFYFHEENGGEEDLIVYHRNKGDKQPKPFPIGSLHTHVSGIDITFEAPDASYRASALIRALFQVKNGNEEKYAEIENPQKKANPTVEYRSTYLYNYLFMDMAISNGITVKWVPDSKPVGELHQGLRKNVTWFENGKKTDRQDTRPWAFSIEEFEPKKKKKKNENNIL